ncbi:conserved hypothetical protein [uncultured Thiomicrorhabdus sp.]
MNQEQKSFVARAIEISAFGQFGAVGYTAFQESNWLVLVVSGLCLVFFLVIAYTVLSIDTVDGGKQ